MDTSCKSCVCRLEDVVKRLLCLETRHKIWTRTPANLTGRVSAMHCMRAPKPCTATHRLRAHGSLSRRSCQWHDERMIVIDSNWTRDDSHYYLTANGRPRNLAQLFNHPKRVTATLRFLVDTGVCAKPRTVWEPG